MEYEILVQLKPEVLDPEARAVTDTLHRLGYNQVKNVVIAKRYQVTVEGAADLEIEKIAKDILANPVSQRVTVKRL